MAQVLIALWIGVDFFFLITIYTAYEDSNQTQRDKLLLLVCFLFVPPLGWAAIITMGLYNLACFIMFLFGKLFSRKD